MRWSLIAQHATPNEATLAVDAAAIPDTIKNYHYDAINRLVADNGKDENFRICIGSFGDHLVARLEVRRV